MAFNKARRPAQGNTGGGGTETVAIRVKSVHLVDDKYIAEKRAPNKSKDDYVIGTLLHPALGMDVEYGPNGESLTEIKVSLREQKNINPDKMGYMIADFRRGAKKDSGPKMGANPVMLLENASLDFKTKEVTCGWLHCALPDSSPERYPNLDAEGATKFDHAHINAWVQVMNEEDAKDKDGKEFKRQRRRMILPEVAVSVSNREELLASETINYLYQDSANGGGTPFLVLRLTQIEPVMNIATTTIFPQWNQDGTPVDAAEVVNAALARLVEEDTSEDKDANFSFYLDHLEAENADGQNYVLEVIPGYQYSTGQKSLPSAMKEGRRKDADSFKSFVLEGTEDGIVSVTRNDGSVAMGQMYSRAHLLIKRGSFEQPDGSVEIGAWYATGTQPVRLAFNGQPNARAEFHQVNDLPTAATPPALAEAFAKFAAKRQELARELMPKKDAAPSTNDADDQIPDQTGGLTPNV